VDPNGKINILLVDDQPAKLLSYEVMLGDLGENLVKANSAREALEHLLKLDVAVVLVDVCMPELDGFELAKMIREHPRFQRTAIIFISAVHISEMDSLRGYDAGAVDYVPVPVVPEVLRAKVRVFAELHRKTLQLEQLNHELESRVSERTAAVAASNAQLLQSEQGRTLALAAGNMGSWHLQVGDDKFVWDEGQYRIFGVDRSFVPTLEETRKFVDALEWERLTTSFVQATPSNNAFQTEMCVKRRSGEQRLCMIAAAVSFDDDDRMVRVDGVTVDITDRRETERRQALLAREVDHRARNALAIVQSVIRLTSTTETTDAFKEAVDGRVRALAQAHELLAQARWQGADIVRLVQEELAPYDATGQRVRISGPSVVIAPDRAQTIALILHELATNAAKYGALSVPTGVVTISWQIVHAELRLAWVETGGPRVQPPSRQGVGTRIIRASASAIRGGHVDFAWPPDGLALTLVVPATNSELVLVRQSVEHDNVVRLQVAAGRRVLLVEDETLTGMFMHDLLESFGYHVAGPFMSVEDALAAAETESICAAILDINLRGKPVDPVADVLVRRSVPFMLVTGYASDHIAERFAQVPALRKPIAPDALRAALMDLLEGRDLSFAAQERQGIVAPAALGTSAGAPQAT
jgi:two-component sensor histidine kinase/DNA-binding response OmpR family regulator